MLDSELARRLDGIEVFERGWLSSNNVLFVDGAQTLMVDSGYCTHSAQTVQLVERALGTRPLDCLVNTHLHSDHCGGNALLQQRYSQLQTLIPPGQASSVANWDPVSLTYEPTGQACPQFRFDRIIEAGTQLQFGLRTWQIHAATGHDPDSVIFFEPEAKILISADALWENGFGVVFPELEGEDAFCQVECTLDLIAALKPEIVIPGHGAVFGYSAEIMSRARERLQYFVANPAKHARHGAKVLIKFKLLESQQLTMPEFSQWARATSYLSTIRDQFFSSDPFDQWIQKLLSELTSSGALKRQDQFLMNAWLT